MSPAEPAEREESPSRENTESTLAAEDSSKDSAKEKEPERIEQAEASPSGSSGQKTPPRPVNIYDEGDNLVFESRDGEVIDVQPAPEEHKNEGLPTPVTVAKADADKLWTISGFKKKMGEVYNVEMEKRKDKGKERKHEPARAYQFGNTVCTTPIAIMAH
jgi:type IV secretory pathway VirB9-like protein